VIDRRDSRPFGQFHGFATTASRANV